MILEGMILRRVQHFEQGSRRIAAPVGAELIDFIEHDHRVHRAGVAQRTNEPSRQGTDVGAAMTAYLRLIPNTAERHTNKLPAGCPRDGFPDRGLPRSRTSDQ